MTTSAKEMKKGLRQVMFYLAAVLLIIGIALGIGWSIRGTRQADFCGIGQAQVLGVRSEKRFVRSNDVRTEIRYYFTLHVSAGSSVFDCEETRKSRNGWYEGDVLPIVYNIKNPREFVLDTSPEELTRWDCTIGIIAIAVFLAGAGCLLFAIRLRRPAMKVSRNDTKEYINGE